MWGRDEWTCRELIMLICLDVTFCVRRTFGSHISTSPLTSLPRPWGSTLTVGHPKRRFLKLKWYLALQIDSVFIWDIFCPLRYTDPLLSPIHVLLNRYRTEGVDCLLFQALCGDTSAPACLFLGISLLSVTPKMDTCWWTEATSTTCLVRYTEAVCRHEFWKMCGPSFPGLDTFSKTGRFPAR